MLLGVHQFIQTRSPASGGEQENKGRLATRAISQPRKGPGVKLDHAARCRQAGKVSVSPSLNQGPSNLILGLPYSVKGLLAFLPGKNRPGSLGAPLGGACEG